MTFFLAVGPEDVTGAFQLPIWMAVAAFLSVVGGFVALGKMLLNEKDSKLALATELAKDGAEDAAKRTEMLGAVTTELKRLAEALDQVLQMLQSRDELTREGMTMLREIQRSLERLEKR